MRCIPYSADNAIYPVLIAGISRPPSYLCEISSLAAGCGQNEIAARLLGAHDALHERIGSRLFPADQPEYDRHSASLRAALGMEAFTAAYEAGRVLDWAQAIALAQEILEPSDAV